MKAQEKCIGDLEKKLDAAVSASRHVCAKKRKAENLQHAAEARVYEAF